MQIVTIKNGSHHRTVFGEDFSMGQRTNNGTVVSVTSTDCQQYKGQSLDKKRLLVKRQGGGGDIICLSAVIKFLLKKYYIPHITLSCDSYYYPLIDHISQLHVTKHPCNLQDLINYDYLIDYDNLVETTSKKADNIYDLFFKHAGYNNVDPALYIGTPSSHVENFYLEELLHKNNIVLKDNVVLVQWMSNSGVRTFDSVKLSLICRKLSKLSNITILIVGTNKNINIQQLPTGNNIYHLVDLKGNLATLRELTRLSDVVVAPDSLFVHLAGETNTPCVALYGPFTGYSRVKYYKNNFFFEATSECAPCFSHKRKCPRNNICWDSIEYRSVYNFIRLLLNNSRITVDLPDEISIDDFRLQRIGYAYSVRKV